MGRIFRVIGCPHGCGDGCAATAAAATTTPSTSSAAEKGATLRAQALSLMTRLLRLDRAALLHHVQRTLMTQATQEVVDFLHALLGFCVDPNSTAAAAASSAHAHSPLAVV